MGFPVLAAARAAKEGCSLDEVTAIAEDMVRRTHLIFVVDTLENLRKGGRISGAKAFLGTAMSIKPLLHFEDGMIMPLKQVRTRKKAITAMLDEIEQRLEGAEMAEVAVIDGDAEVVGDEVAEMVKARFGPAEVLRSPISPVIGTHAGPGAVGVAFYMKE